MGADGFTFASTEDRLARAANGLADSHPHLSARGGLTSIQRKALGIGIALIIIAGMIAAPVLYWTGFGLFSVMIVWRAALVGSILGATKDETEFELSDAELPRYSILVALYDEADSVRGLVDALDRLDYPREKLDIHFLLEVDDRATHVALSLTDLPTHMFVHSLPAGVPQTKPRALNYGLDCAAGEYITIYDAEDRPHPEQLRAAANAFASSHESIACLQAPLKAHNARQSWIAGQWGLEYDIQFGLLVPALSLAGFPIPLGGTSNHFKRSALDFVGGWDAWNVTEDADLGLRLARHGYGVGTIEPATLEEAPEDFKIWAAQRSRWIKGFIQSWLVLMRDPRQSLQDMGPRNWLAMQVTLGGAIFSALLAGPMAIWLLLCLILPDLHLGFAGIALLCCGYGVNLMTAIVAPGDWTIKRAISVATLPLYWPLLSLGAVRALYGLAATPHFWAKTPHGLTAARIDEGQPTCSLSTGYSP